MGIYTTTFRTGCFTDDFLTDVIASSFHKSVNDYYNDSAKELIKIVEQDRKRQKVKDFNDSIRKVIFNDPAVVIIWKDGTKTTVKCQKGDKFDKEKGLAIAIVKHIFGDMGYYNTIFDKWLNEED